MILDLTAMQSCVMGRILERLYYHTDILDLFDRDKWRGYPHNGGEHTFRITTTPEECIILLELFQSVISNEPILQTLIDLINENPNRPGIFWKSQFRDLNKLVLRRERGEKGIFKPLLVPPVMS